MRNDKLKQFTSILERRHHISFYLYNVRYNIEVEDKILILSNNGSSYLYKYNNIRELFTDNLVYGSSLAECFDDIIIEK